MRLVARTELDADVEVVVVRDGQEIPLIVHVELRRWD
jgi:hypothetical protein